MNKNKIIASSIIIAVAAILVLIIFLLGDGIIGFVAITFGAVVNNPPELDSIENQTLVLGNDFVYDANASDLDNHTLSFSTNYSIFPINNVTGVISFTANMSHYGIKHVRIIVSDEFNWSDSQIIVFNVTGAYCGDGTCAGNESCSNCPQDCGSCETSLPSGGTSAGGGGSMGSGFVDKGGTFKIDRKLIRVRVKQGETVIESVEIKNTGVVPIEIIIDVNKLKNLIVPDEYAFSLEMGESRVINFTIYAKKDIVPDVYSGIIKIKFEEIALPINTIIEVESSEALFDIDFFIPIGLKEIEQGGIIRADISISAISQIEPMESRLIYVIKDMDGNVIISQEGTILVGDSASSYVEMKLPGDIDIGDHVFYVKLIYKDNMFMRSDLFTVIGEESPLSLVEKPAPIWEESYFKIISFIAVFFVASILAYMAFTNFAVLYNIKAMIANVDKHIKDGELDEAKSAYLKVKDLYHKLSKRTKKKVYLKCMEFHRKLNMK